MKNILTTAALLFSMIAFAQVGINNTSPKATLDITPKTTDGSKPEGLLIPQLDGNSLKTTAYGTSQKGVIVYAKSAASPTDTKTVNVTAEGYYYFDGSVWQKMTGASAADATTTAKGIVKLAGDLSGTAASPSIASSAVTSAKIADGTVANADLASGAGGIYKGDGSLSGNTTVTQGTNTLAFTSTASTGTSHFTVDGTTLNVDAVNNRVGIGTNTPAATLDVVAKTTNGTQPEGFIAPRLTGDQIKSGDGQYGTSQKGAIIYALSAVTTASTKTANMDAEGYYIFDGSKWIKLLSQAQSVPQQILNVSVPGTQNIKNTTVVTEFTTENIDTYNAWNNNIFTVPSNLGGIYTVNFQISNTRVMGGTGSPSWFVISTLQRSADGGASWTDLIRDTRTAPSLYDVDNGNILFWSGILNGGDLMRVYTQCSSPTDNIIGKGSLVITKL
ncbi:hypothetical protein SAMN05421856_101401 [Chryseobacterium taichungense]|uniref:Uncharacterized protein n=1 Tax=Chryseobacterium taichungense TaxID=295069 RepID=A0A1H7W0E4_9FLAO|nr:hypothetical protein [Chryseobacterium taichungense]SEM14961.1 hypothetical protein SAMN05421856_101401 [Chryseobacterium taichungense]